jgi:hypothetical protein
VTIKLTIAVITPKWYNMIPNAIHNIGLII